MGKERLLPQAAERQRKKLRLPTVALPGVKKFFDQRVPLELQHEYEAGLKTVKRMKTIREQGFLRDPNFVETNLDHTVLCLEIAKEYMKDHPVLAPVINFDEVQIMLAVHDAGEIHPSIGDVQPLNRSEKDKQRKKLELPVAIRHIFSQIPDPQNRADIVKFYERYNANNPDDPEVQMAHFIDKAQGTARAAHIAFNVHKTPDISRQQRIIVHLWGTLPRMMAHGTNLLTIMDDRAARLAIREISNGELDKLIDVGAVEPAQTYKETVLYMAENAAA